jgi:WD40-like Beta Propeller Repeat
MSADGTSLRRVTTSPSIDFQPTWSPDGRRLAFARNVPGYHRDIFVVGVDGKGFRRLTTNRGDDFEPDWAPNGSRIAWSFGASRASARPGIYTMNPDGSSKRFRGAGIAPDWSPDGRRFVLALLQGDLWTEAVGGTDRRPLSVAPGADARPEWSPDGTQGRVSVESGEPDRAVPPMACRCRQREPAPADAGPRQRRRALVGSALAPVRHLRDRPRRVFATIRLRRGNSQCGGLGPGRRLKNAPRQNRPAIGRDRRSSSAARRSRGLLATLPSGGKFFSRGRGV